MSDNTTPEAEPANDPRISETTRISISFAEPSLQVIIRTIRRSDLRRLKEFIDELGL